MSFKVLALELNKTASVFRTELSAVAIETYWESLSGYTDEDLRWACKQARETCEFMPTIRDLRALLWQRRRAEAPREEAKRWLAQNAGYRPKSWPRLGQSEPTPVAELVAPYIGPTEKH